MPLLLLLFLVRTVLYTLKILYYGIKLEYSTERFYGYTYHTVRQYGIIPVATVALPGSATVWMVLCG